MKTRSSDNGKVYFVLGIPKRERKQLKDCAGMFPDVDQIFFVPIDHTVVDADSEKKPNVVVFAVKNGESRSWITGRVLAYRFSFGDAKIIIYAPDERHGSKEVTPNDADMVITKPSMDALGAAMITMHAQYLNDRDGIH